MTLLQTRAHAVRAYSDDDAAAWDELVARSCNGTMLHTRRFLSYHGDRFRDRSLLVTDARERIVGALPAAEDQADPSVVTSHPGLTYGGLVHSGALSGGSMIDVLETIAAHYRCLGYTRWRYKAVPAIYQSIPAADDLYALFRLGASRYRCDLAAVVGLDRGRPLSRQRSRGLKQALRAGVRVEDGWRNIAAFWRVLETNLARRHNSAPTHSLAEIEYLHDRFPGSFFLVVAKIGDSLVGGDVHTIEGPVMQGRYTATTDEGRAACATDLLLDRGVALAREQGCRFFSFGTSTFDEGRALNESQYEFKISFGATGLVHDHYELSLR
jgi:Acetyltransferase (GNAT) domain